MAKKIWFFGIIFKRMTRTIDKNKELRMKAVTEWRWSLKKKKMQISADTCIQRKKGERERKWKEELYIRNVKVRWWWTTRWATHKELREK